MNKIFGRFMESWILRVSCKVKPEGLHVNFAGDPKYSWFHEPYKNWSYCLYLHLIIRNWYIEIIYNLRDKTILYLIFNNIKDFVGVQNRKAEQPVWTWTANGANKKLVLHMQLVNHNTSVTSGEWIGCSKRIAQASEIGSCQSNFVWFMRLWTLAKF